MCAPKPFQLCPSLHHNVEKTGPSLTTIRGETTKRIKNKYGNNLRVTVLRSTAKPKLQAESWIVPDGIELKIPKSILVAEIPFKVTKRTLYRESDSGPCSNYDNYGFANVLLTNPGVKGVLVAVLWNQSDRADYTVDILERFRALKVPRNRIRIFFKRVKRTPRTELGYWEMWLVPNKKQ